jgi:hypothetical protein
MGLVKAILVLNSLISCSCSSYTHYWHISNTAEWLKIWRKLVADAKLIIAVADVPVFGWSAYAGIELNGEGAYSHEHFYLLPRAEKNYCKTAREPYDIVVTAILLRASQLAGKTIEVRYATPLLLKGWLGY